MRLYGENLKTGKDVREIERGKCACGECEDFMRSDEATCGYCGCLPTRHSKKDARYSSDSVCGTSAAGTSESASSEKWKDEDLRWFPKLSVQARVAQGKNPHRRLILYQNPRGNIKIRAKADTGRERQLCSLGEDNFLIYKFFDTCK